MRPVPTVLAGAALAGAGCLAWGAGYEVRAFRLRELTVAVLPAGQDPLRVLHLSDLHMTPGQRRKQAWVASLDALDPDLVVTTGDNLAHPDAVGPVLDCLAPLLHRPGAFVLGSNDYFAPRPKNPARYLLADKALLGPGPELPWPDLVAGMTSAGWADLTNARATVKAGGRAVELLGVDDPHIHRDRYDAVAGPVTDADLGLGVVHAPYRRVLNAMAADELPLVLAGHTHGGQLCVPVWGALVTNCDLPTRQASGLSAHTPGTLLHVSAGLGTSPYAPVRFACPPEATLLTLVAAG